MWPTSCGSGGVTCKLRPRRRDLQVVAQEVWPASGGPGGVAC